MLFRSASLALSANPRLTPELLKGTLLNTARPFPANTVALGSQAECTPALCGAGIADAAAVVRTAQLFAPFFRKVAGGRTHSVGLRADGTLFAWGDNFQGQIGDGTTNTQLAPVSPWLKVVSTASALVLPCPPGALNASADPKLV